MSCSKIVQHVLGKKCDVLTKHQPKTSCCTAFHSVLFPKVQPYLWMPKSSVFIYVGFNPKSTKQRSPSNLKYQNKKKSKKEKKNTRDTRHENKKKTKPHPQKMLTQKFKKRKKKFNFSKVIWHS